MKRSELGDPIVGDDERLSIVLGWRGIEPPRHVCCGPQCFSGLGNKERCRSTATVEPGGCKQTLWCYLQISTRCSGMNLYWAEEDMIVVLWEMIFRGTDMKSKRENRSHSQKSLVLAVHSATYFSVKQKKGQESPRK